MYPKIDLLWHQSVLGRYAFLIGLFLWSGFGSHAQILDTLRISKSFTNTPLNQVLGQLESSYQFPIYVKQSWLSDKQVNIGFSDELLPQVLDKLLREHGLAFAILNRNSVIIAPERQLSREFSQAYLVQRANQQRFMNEQAWPASTEFIELGEKSPDSENAIHTVRATLYDGLDNSTIVGAIMHVKDLDMTATSDQNGGISLDIPSGLHMVEITMLGYDSKIFGLTMTNDADWEIDLLPEATELDEVLVSATTDDNNVRSTVVGMSKISSLDIQEMPVFLGEPDVIKTILTLPGVSTVGEGAGGFNVRGGNIDQNLISQDGALVFNSSHAMGFFSVFNPDVIRDVTLYKGHMPAQFGGRVSSVLDVRLKGNNYENLKVSGGVGMLASRVAIETPIVKGKTALMVGGRVAYSDWVLNFVDNPNVRNSSLNFYDINAKISQRLGQKGSLSLSAYNSHDRFSFSDEFGFSWDLNTASLKWDQIFGQGLISEFSVSYSSSGNTSFQPSGADGFRLGNGMNNLKIKEDLLITKWQKHQVNVGFEINAYVPEDEVLTPYDENSSVIEFQGTRDRGIESSIFINDAFDISPRLSMSLGLRFNSFTQYGPSTVYLYDNGVPNDPENDVDSLVYGSWDKVISYQGLDPRVSARYTLTSSSSVKLSYNRVHQFIHLISNTTAALPIDYWQVSNTYFKPLKAHNFSLGYFKNFRLNQWETSAEVYYRDLENIVEYRDFPELFLNDQLETELISGKGRSYGLELYLKKKTGKINGWVSYTYARTFIQILDQDRDEYVNNGEWFPSKFDQPHDLSIVGNYNFNKTNQLSFNFTYRTGRALTGPNANYELDGYVIPNYSDRNEFRLPAYHRLDVSYTIQRGLFRTSRYNDSFTFSIYNLYARQNAYSVYFRRDRRNVFGAYKLSILGTMLPSITYNFNF